MDSSNSGGVIQFIECVKSGDLEGIEARLATSPELATAKGADGVSALMVALYHRQDAVADRLRACVGDLDLHEAAAFGDRDGVEAILAGDGAGVDDRSADGFTALHLAAYFGRSTAATRLLERGAAPNAVAENPSRLRPLHSAAAAGSDAIVLALLAAGADVDARQAGGFTALHAAALHGRLEMGKSLLDAGANPDLATDDQRTARAMAAEHDDRRLFELMRNEG